MITTPAKNRTSVQASQFSCRWSLSQAEVGHFRKAPKHQEDILQKELFLQVFKWLPECKGVTFRQTNPGTADFAVQIDNGLDGRFDKWQWVLYRTDTDERLAFGEEADVTSATKNVCMALRANVESIGGKVE